MKSKASDKHRTKSLCTLSLASTPLVIALLLVWGVATSNAAWADNSVVDRVTLTIPTSCSMSGSIDPGDEHTTSIIPGTYVNNIGITNIKALCNDFEGFSIYAVGYTDNTEGNNKMIGANTNEEIVTGTATSGDTSNWAMKLTSIAGPYAPIIDSPYSNYSAVPSRYTKVAHYTANSGSSATDQSTGSNLETTYAAYMSSVQASDTYTGQVKYLLTHPASIDSVSSAGVTLEFQTYPGSDMHFADGSTTNTMELRQVCDSEPVSGDGYQFNTTINIDNDTHFEVEGIVYNDDYAPYEFDYMAVNTDYGMPIFSFFYNETTGDYTMGDGFVYLPYPLVIPEYGINYETAGWYFGNVNDPTSFVPVDAPTITITGGSEAEDSDFLAWLEDNTFSAISYEFNTTINIDNDTYFEVEGVVYNDNHAPYNFISMAVNTDYGMPIFSFFYNETTGDYTMGDGFVYLPYPLVIPEYGINYETAGWYFGNANNPTSFVLTDAPTMIITGGSEAEDSDFLAWLGSNATASASANIPTNCRLAVLSGEYEEPVGYKGTWDINLDSYEYTRMFNGGETEFITMLEKLAGLGGLANYFGQTISIYAYDGSTITYDGNNATAGTMSRRLISEDEDITLSVPNYYKSGYGFAGWSTSNSATPTNGATIYGPNETVNESVLSQHYDSDGNVTLYAVWVQSTGNMQGFSCSSLARNSITALTDTRDGNVYTVGRLADYKCWMMENLRLDGSATLSSTNTNNPVISSLGNSQTSWCTQYDSAACINQSLINTDNPNNLNGSQLLAASDGLATGPHYGYGTYYNWYAATAGNGTYSTTSRAAGDICPAGWRLPNNDYIMEFKALSNAITPGATDSAASAGLRAYPANFVYSGGWDGSYESGRAVNGYYWSRSASLDGGTFNLGFFSYGVSLSIGVTKDDGFSIRCVQSAS